MIEIARRIRRAMMTTSDRNTVVRRDGLSETGTEDIEGQRKKTLEDIEAKNEIVKGIEQLRRKGRLQHVVATCEALNGNKEKLRAYLHLTVNIVDKGWQELQKLLVDAILYYLIRDGKPDEQTQHMIETIHKPGLHFRQSEFDWYEWCCILVDHGFHKFYSRLGNNPAVFEHIIHKQPQLILNGDSDLLIVGLASVIPHDRIHRILMNIRDEKGKTHLFKVSAIALTYPYVEHYSEHVDDLYELLSIQDLKGQTALHVNTKLITNILIHTYTEEHRDRLMKLITIKDKNGKTVLDETVLDMIDDKIELSWLQDPRENNPFIRYIKPTVLIAYTTKNRLGAEDEARSIYDAFKSLHYNVKFEKDLEKENLIDSIEQLAKGTACCGQPPSALIVVLMSHGSVGTIDDSEGNPISLTEIEAAMCEKNRMSDNPKILITQCCQSRDSQSQLLNQDPSSSTSDAGPAGLKKIPYVCTINRNFCAYLSSVRGQTSDRGVFINKFAAQIKNCKENETIDSLFKKVCQEMKSEKRDQIPIQAGNTLMHEFCPANCGPNAYLFAYAEIMRQLS